MAHVNTTTDRQLLFPHAIEILLNQTENLPGLVDGGWLLAPALWSLGLQAQVLLDRPCQPASVLGPESDCCRPGEPPRAALVPDTHSHFGLRHMDDQPFKSLLSQMSVDVAVGASLKI